MDAENKKGSCLQKDSAEHEEYVGAYRSFNRIWKERDSAQPELLGKILEKDNLNKAFKRVKANKGAPGIDGVTIDSRRSCVCLLFFIKKRKRGVSVEYYNNYNNK